MYITFFTGRCKKRFDTYRNTVANNPNKSVQVVVFFVVVVSFVGFSNACLLVFVLFVFCCFALWVVFCFFFFFFLYLEQSSNTNVRKKSNYCEYIYWKMESSTHHRMRSTADFQNNHSLYN